MVQLSEIIDPQHQDKAKYNSFENFFIKRLNDKRDLPFIYLLTKVTLLLLPLAAIVFLNEIIWPNVSFWWRCLVALIYLVFLATMLGPFTLLLHNTSHNKLFKNEKHNYWIPWFFGLLFGQSPGLYYLHHIGMHHAENNMLNDDSTTVIYQRDSFRAWLTYLIRFFLKGIANLAHYYGRKKLNKLKRKVIVGEVFYIMIIIGSAFLNWKASLVVFLFPVILIRVLMMMGNWAQHAFIASKDPSNSWLNSITCINSLYNKQCFNDGYHIGHHIHPKLHWTEMPANFLSNVDKYAEMNAIVFEKLDYNQVWFFLMTKQYHKLARQFVNIGNRFSSDDEIIELLRNRTLKFQLTET